MKVSFNAKKDKFYYIFARGVITQFGLPSIVHIVDADGNEIGHQLFHAATGMQTVHMNLTIRSQWEGLTTLWLHLENGSWYFSQTEAPSIVVRTV